MGQIGRISLIFYVTAMICAFNWLASASPVTDNEDETSPPGQSGSHHDAIHSGRQTLSEPQRIFQIVAEKDVHVFDVGTDGYHRPSQEPLGRYADQELRRLPFRLAGQQ